MQRYNILFTAKKKTFIRTYFLILFHTSLKEEKDNRDKTFATTKREKKKKLCITCRYLKKSCNFAVSYRSK